MAAQQFDARRSGATEGVTRTAGSEQAVFAGSVAKTGSAAKTDSAAKKDAEGAASTDAAASPATGSATGNLWSGFAPEKSTSLSAALGSSAAPQSDGLGVQAISMAILGLGLTGLLGGFLVAAIRRQRVEATRSSGRNDR